MVRLFPGRGGYSPAAGSAATLDGMTPHTTTTLVTGAGRGLGLETTRRLVAAGHTVYAGVRDTGSGEEAVRAAGARPLPLDVTSDASVRAAARHVRETGGRLDVLVNNAGILGSAEHAGDVRADDMLTVYDTNVFGPVRVLHAFLSLLRESAAPAVVNVSSGLGSLAAATDRAVREKHVPVWFPALPYNSSKAALNMVTAQYAHAYPGIRVNAVDPGYTATDFNGHTGPQTVAQGAEIIVRMATAGQDAPTGGYFAADGPVPW